MIAPLALAMIAPLAPLARDRSRGCRDVAACFNVSLICATSASSNFLSQSRLLSV
jgi:hypothetical protein